MSLPVGRLADAVEMADESVQIVVHGIRLEAKLVLERNSERSDEVQGGTTRRQLVSW